MELAPGEGFERYVIESLIGRGGMGAVYLARDERLGRRVALKVLAAELAADPDFRRRFEVEAHLAASLDEPHIVPIYAADEYEGRLYIAMRYVAGFDLETLLRRHGPLPSDRAVRIIEQIAAALDAAHSAGLVHRDVKPANVLVATGSDGTDHAYLTDFGLARSTAYSGLTKPGQVVGSLDYIAPEQIDGRSVDQRADVYALGGVLFACLTGAPPFRAPTDAALMYLHLQGAPPVPSESAPGIPAGLDAVVARAMAKDPATRFATAGELAQAASLAVAGSTAEMRRTGPTGPSPELNIQSHGDVRKTVTILFTDLVGSTSIGEKLDPEALRTVMQAYFDEVRTVVEHHGGIVEKFIGDAAVGVFGVPVVHEDDALRAIRAAADIGQRLDTLSNHLGARMGVQIVPRSGISTGEVVSSGSPSGGPIAMGDAVNTAARLQQSAEPGQILVGESTMRLVRGEVRAERRPDLDAKGKSKPLVPYLFQGFTPRRGSGVAHIEAPLVGRDSELAVLRETWQRTKSDRTPRLLTLLGVAGVGKSRLVHQLASEATGAQLFYGRCLPYGEAITYWPIREIIQGAAGITDADTNETAQTRIVGLLGADPQARLLAERLAMAVGLMEGSAPQQEIFWAVRRLLEELGRATPTIVVLEDLGWAEQTLLDLIEYVVDLAADTPLLLLATARPEILETRPGWSAGHPNTNLVRIDPLGRDAALDLVRAQPGGAAIPAQLADRIGDRAEGNPLFVEEMIAMLRDEGALRKGANQDWEFVTGHDSIDIPPTIRALLAARIDRLAPSERRVAECASVIGRSFEVAALAELLPLDFRSALDTNIRGLVRRELIQPDRAELSAGDAFRFRHILIRDAAYESLPKAERAGLHRQFADWLAAAAGDRLPEFTEICGYHLEQSYRYLSALAVDRDRAEIGDQASSYLAAAGQRADSRGEPAAAESLLQRAIELCSAASPGRAELLIRLARVQRARGEFDAARRSLDAARADLQGIEGARLGWLADIESVLLNVQTAQKGTLERDKALLVDAGRGLTALGDDYGVAVCLIAEGSIHELEGRNSAAAASFTEALSHAEKAPDKRTEVDSLQRLILNLLLGDAPVSVGIVRCEEVLAAWPDQPRMRASTLDSYASLLTMAKRFEEARGAELSALAIASDLDDKLNEGLYRVWGLGTILALDDDLPGAAAEARRGCQLLLDLGERAWLSSVACILGELELALGDQAAARRWLTLADEAAIETDIDARTRIRVLSARLAAQAGDLPTALKLAEDAVSALDGSELLYLRGIAATALGQVLVSAGRRADGRRRLSEAIALHQKKGDIARADRVRRIRETPTDAPSIPLV